MNQAASSVGERSFGRYHIVRPLKIGGTAAIYLAIMRGENNFSREVVIKRPLPHLVADHRARLMFVDEAHIASRLAHPNICQVLDLVAREDELYLVLEYLRGVDLREVLKRCIQLNVLMPPEVAVYLAIDVCSGLDFAHEATGLDGNKLDIVHRDVSPKNIRLTDSGSVKIIDFGIARALGRATETAVGTIKGTLGYMSPEQILGDEIDRRSDIFAFGICLFQMLTCRNPFDGPSLKERVRRLTQAPIPSIREFNGALDDEIAGIVQRCLERDVDVRYQRMRDIQTELDRYLARLQVVSPRQRLIRFLEEIFPDIHDADIDLKLALTEASSGIVGKKIDSEVRLIFPDDPNTQSEEKTRPTISDSSASTKPPSTSASQRSQPIEENFGIEDTKPVPRRSAGSEASQAATELEAPRRSEARSLPWALIGVVFVLLALVVVMLTLVIIDRTHVETAPIENVEGAIDAGVAIAEVIEPVAPPPSAHVEPPVPPTHEAPPTKIATPPPPPPRVVAPPPPGRVGADRARLVFRTGARLQSLGRADDAKLMYQIAFDLGGHKPDAAIFRNLGVLYNQQGEVPKAKACLRAYLARNPDAPDADTIRTTLSSFPVTNTVPCVSPDEVHAARRRQAREGAKIDAWVEETVEKRLR